MALSQVSTHIRTVTRGLVRSGYGSGVGWMVGCSGAPGPTIRTVRTGAASSTLVGVTPRGPKPNGWLSTQQTCSYLGITLRTLYKLIDQGDVPAYKMGRVIRLRQGDVDEWLAASRIAPGSLSHLYPDTRPTEE